MDKRERGHQRPYREEEQTTLVTNLHYIFIYYILDNLIWLYFPLTPIEKSNRPIVYHVVRLPMRFKQGELKVSRTCILSESHALCLSKVRNRQFEYYNCQIQDMDIHRRRFITLRGFYAWFLVCV